MESTELTPLQQQALDQLAETGNEALETAGQASANYAFNLGCSVTLIPAALIVIVTFVLGRFNIVVAFVTAILALMAGLVFANLASFLAKKRSVEQTYLLRVEPEIERSLKSLELSRATFDLHASAHLPDRAALRSFLSVPDSEPAHSSGPEA